MATRSSILAWEILARGASWATVRGAAESDTHTLIIQMKIALIKKKKMYLNTTAVNHPVIST